jgi:glycosyltransferase involved in cell wall biosynthesis
MINYPDSWRDTNAVLCHDWLTGMRGGERCLELLCDGFPKAPIHTLIHNRPAISDTINSHPIHTSCVQHLPGINNHYRNMLPLFPAAVRTLKPQSADVMISLSHCVAKSIRPAKGTPHISYCFTPMRYAWTFFEEYFGNSTKAQLVRPLLAILRDWDRRTANRVDTFVAISHHVAKRIKRFYGRDSEMVYPPVDVHRCTPGTPGDDGYVLIVSAMVPYKRVDLAVRAYSQANLPLRVVGVGGQLDELRQLAGPSVQILGWQSDEAILELYRRCRLLVFPGEEDFGIVPLEAQACGKPVVAFRKGGALETVRENETGCFFDEQTEAALLDAVQTCTQTNWDPTHIRNHAMNFSPQVYIDGIARVIDKTLATPLAQR